jgi:hypothetical protein
MVPGLLIGLRSGTIDYDAVAYRTGVILAEDPGMPGHSGWELIDSAHKEEVIRMGLAVAGETPGILSPLKIERFFSDDFQYPADYQHRLIFSNHPYLFNISLRTLDGRISLGRGDQLPVGYGYVRRSVMVKVPGNTTVNASGYQNTFDNSSARVFHVDLDLPALLNASRSEAYSINPLNERVVLNITNLQATLYDPYNGAGKDLTTLSHVHVYVDGSLVPPDRPVFIDGAPASFLPPCTVRNDITLVLEPGYLTQIADTDSRVSIEFTFDDGADQKNTTFTGSHRYDYNPANVTQPYLTPAVMEVAVW